jgi:hypothetical protein
MVINPEKNGLIQRTPGVTRPIRVLVPTRDRDKTVEIGPTRGYKARLSAVARNSPLRRRGCALLTGYL